MQFCRGVYQPWGIVGWSFGDFLYLRIYVLFTAVGLQDFHFSPNLNFEKILNTLVSHMLLGRIGLLHLRSLSLPWMARRDPCAQFSWNTSSDYWTLAKGLKFYGAILLSLICDELLGPGWKAENFTLGPIVIPNPGLSVFTDRDNIRLRMWLPKQYKICPGLSCSEVALIVYEPDPPFNEGHLVIFVVDFSNLHLIHSQIWEKKCDVQRNLVLTFPSKLVI